MEHPEIKLPSNIKGLRITHFNGLLELDSIDQVRPSIGDKIRVINLFTDVPVDILRTYQVPGLNKVFHQIKKVCDTYHPKPFPPHQLIFEGQKYNLVSDFSKMPTGWFADLSAFKFKDEPARLAALCYIEDGMIYAQMDKNKNILNLSGDRMKVFEKHMKLNHYIDLSSFFLRIYVEWKGSSIQTEKRIEELTRMKKQLARLSGKL